MNLTKQECQTLLALLDIATKAGGLNVAQNALYFAQKVDEYSKTIKEEKIKK